MIVYRDAQAEPVETAALLAASRAQARSLSAGGGPTHDDAVDLLIEIGTLEAAVADALCPEVDGLPPPPLRALRRASLAAGRLLRRSWRGEPGPDLRAEAGGVAAELETVGPLPALVGPKTLEGYAYYALYPETYLAAAERFAASFKPGSPPVVACIGLRSIGTSLSAVVAAALEAAGARVESLTLRPRGHPFSRRPAVTAGLAAALGALRGAWFLIVDEGPGLSGSSFAGTAELLAGLGVAEERVVLFPSHAADPGALRSEAARERWPRLAKAHAPFEEAWLPRAPFPSGSRDVAGGAWRALLGLREEEWPAVEPRHERRKYLSGEPGGGGRLVMHKFVGLGRRGRRADARATALAEAGFSPPAHGLARGFLAQAFVPGQPLGPRDGADAPLLAMAGRYFGRLARDFALGGAPARPERLLGMVRANVAEGLGECRLADLTGVERHLRELGEAPAVAIDGRALRHEWLRTTSGGYLKTDATDHHDDHFYPGPADIAWDVAAFGAEFGLADAALARLAADVARRAGDPGLARRLPFHATAYLAFRLGYTALAATTLAGTADGRRMAAASAVYRAGLDAALRRLAAATPSSAATAR